MLVETALGIAAIALLVLPFLSFATAAGALARDRGEISLAARRIALSPDAPPGVTFECSTAPNDDPSTPSDDPEPCESTLGPETYVVVRRETVVQLVLGLEMRFEQRAVARVD